MFSLRLLRQTLVRSNNIKQLVRGGHDHHGPMMPPFARLKPVTTKLPEEVELVWDDMVAPETCIDFDAPHVSSGEALAMFLGSFAFFVGLYVLVSISDPVGSNPVALRIAVMPPNMVNQHLALDFGDVTSDGDEQHHDDEEEEDDE